MADRYDQDRQRIRDRERGHESDRNREGREEWRDRREFNQGSGGREFGREGGRFGEAGRETWEGGGSFAGQEYRGENWRGTDGGGGRYGTEGRYGNEGRWPDEGRGAWSSEGSRSGEGRTGAPSRGWQDRPPENWGETGGGFGGGGGFRGGAGDYRSGSMGRGVEWSAGHGGWAGSQSSGFGNYPGAGSYYGEQGSFGGGIGQYGRGRYSGRGPKGYKRSDDRIKEDVCERLTQDPFVDAVEIEVQVRDGEVILTGTVDSRQSKRRAEDIAENVSGVRELHNQIRVQQPGLSGENAITTTGSTGSAGGSTEASGSGQAATGGQTTTSGQQAKR
jgi:BON domain-containing protein